jgi:Clostripain family
MSPSNEPGWLVMLYLAGDNNLTEEMVRALQSLGAADPMPGTRIVAQLDPSGLGLPTQRYDFTSVRPGQSLDAYLQPCCAIAETNTGNPNALSDFIKWANDLPWTDSSHPKPERQLLILSGHGSGTTEDFLLKDDNAADALSINELSIALKDAYAKTHRKIDILGMDACFMSMFEVAYEIRDCVSLLVGAEGLEPEFGWPHSRILEKAREISNAKGRHISPEELARTIVTEYTEFYSDYDRTAGRSADLAALDLSGVDALATAVTSLGDSLIASFVEDPKNHDLVTLAHWKAQTYKSDQYVDLHDLCIQLYETFARSTDVRSGCEGVIKVLDGDRLALDAIDDPAKVFTTGGTGCIVKAGCTGFAHQHSYGLSVYFPWALVSKDYENLAFFKEKRSPVGGWPEFLNQHVNATRRKPRFGEGDKRDAHLPAEEILATVQLNLIESLIPKEIQDRVPELKRVVADRIRVRKARLEARGVSRVDALDGVFEVGSGSGGKLGRFTGVGSRFTGVGSRFTGVGSRFAGVGSRFPADREKAVKNLAPVIGIAYWPPDAADERVGSIAEPSREANQLTSPAADR